MEQIPKETGEYTGAGETTIADEVVASIAGVAAKEVEGVAGVGKFSVRRMLAERLGGAEGKARGVEVEVGTVEAVVDLSLNVLYGFNIPKIIAEVRKKVASRLVDLAGLEAKEINVHIVGIEFPEKVERKVK
jgi:uncharacterized alkaline shock family protein YloU